MLNVILMETWRQFCLWLIAKFSKPKPVSDPLISVSTGSDIGAIAGAVGDGEKLATAIITAEDTPEMVAARYNVSLQSAKDAIAKHNSDALKSGDVTKVNKDLS